MLGDKEFMKRNSTMYVVGPFTEHSLADSMYESEFAFIAAGAGITPFLNVIRSRKGQYDAVNIVAHVTSRNLCDFELIMEAIADARKNGVSSEVYIYWTGREENKRTKIEAISSHYGFLFDSSPSPVKKHLQDESEIDTKRDDVELDLIDARKTGTPECDDCSTPENVLVLSQNADLQMNRALSSVGMFTDKSFGDSQLLEVNPNANPRSTAARRKTILKRREERRSTFRKMFSQPDLSKFEDNPTSSFSSVKIEMENSEESHITKPMGDGTPFVVRMESWSEVELSTYRPGDGLLPKNLTPMVSVNFRENRLNMEEVLASTQNNLYFVGPALVAKFLNRICAQNDRKMFYTTWS
eukprot:CAMPEP_0115013724 /NCGR_PEP_ID=MMETSP0216-20121206/25598_1 /TAXON_ID=223996 /ORGANISM="Protocruzia adherens, Strain Boccale" /LENGTH=354 /DNA_ID=CAMNT_0002383217 /DNA_START=878 /DNA_END=1942 /DNA_ORIENTATION=-